MMNYGAYDINRVPQSLKLPVAPQTQARNMEKAAGLSRKVLALIRKGDLDAAIAVLKKVVADFPETPQAVEARELLSGLPGGTVRR
jgi:TolA-binding protein